MIVASLISKLTFEGISAGSDAGRELEDGTHDEHRRHHQVAHQHPQQIADVAGRQRIQPDPAEDRRQRDQHDRRVNRREQRAQRRVRQRDPLVTRVVLVPSPAWTLPR